MKEKLKISLPIIVEGRYDKARLQSVADAVIIATDGFGIFREKEKRQLLCRLAENGGVIALTDADGGGLLIRSYLKRVLPPGSVRNVYIPRVEGRESRKRVNSKEGLLGVEGMSEELLYDLLAPFADGAETPPLTEPLTKAEFYSEGYSGGEDSASKRLELAEFLRLPRNLSSNALLEAINMLGLRGEYEKFNERVKNGDDRKN